MADRIVVMDQGRIVQIGSPLEIYQQPATPFVADFVGQMNFLPGLVSSEGVGLFRTGPFALRVQGWQNHLPPGSEVMLAVRPEELRIEREHAGLGNVLLTQVRSVEFMGPHYRLLLHYAHHADETRPVQLVVNLPKSATAHHDLRDGATLPIHAPADTLRVFRLPQGASR